MPHSSVRLDLRAVLPAAALAVVVLVIIFVELRGREDISPPAQTTPSVQRATATPGPTFTPGPSPTPGPAQPTATQEAPTGGEDRDIARVQDLAAIQEALEEYREENGAYPDTGGNIQTLCVFTAADAGCDLEEVLDPLPRDPLGAPGTNGYWYESTRTRFILYAQRESELFSECPAHPAHLQNFDSLLCVQGP